MPEPGEIRTTRCKKCGKILLMGGDYCNKHSGEKVEHRGSVKCPNCGRVYNVAVGQRINCTCGASFR